MLGLVPWPEIAPTAPLVEMQSLNHGTIREMPSFLFKVKQFLSKVKIQKFQIQRSPRKVTFWKKLGMYEHELDTRQY